LKTLSWIGGTIIPKLESAKDMWIQRERWLGEPERIDEEKNDKDKKDNKKNKEIYLILPIIGYLVQAQFNISVIEVAPFFYIGLGLLIDR
jgi:hypothetical protein